MKKAEVRLSAAEMSLMIAGRVKSQPYPEEFKKHIVSFVREGTGLRTLARQFGISPTLIRNWSQSDKSTAKPSSFQRIRIVDTPKRDLLSRTYCVVSPRGYAVEGLTFDETAMLIARLEA